MSVSTTKTMPATVTRSTTATATVSNTRPTSNNAHLPIRPQAMPWAPRERHLQRLSVPDVLSCNPSNLMPESFTASGDLENYLQEFDTAALLSGWYSPAHDNRSQYFPLQLRGNALLSTQRYLRHNRLTSTRWLTPSGRTT